MKKQLLLLLLVVIFLGCASTDNIDGTSDEREVVSTSNLLENSAVDVTFDANFTDVIGFDWELIAVYIDGVDSQFSRDTLSNDFSNVFTINFNDEGRLSGVGAPNRYSAPYTESESQAISIGLMISTMMAALFQPENLSEHDFFAYVSNAHTWRILNNNLELLSTTQDDKEVLLVFKK